MSKLVDFSLGEIGDLFRGIREAITGEKIEDPIAVLSKLSSLQALIVQAKAKVVEAEAKSEHWIVASWRPITMLTFVFIIANNYIFVPYAEVLFSVKVPTLELTEQMWELIKLGLGGYVIGRSFEKAAANWRKKEE